MGSLKNLVVAAFLLVCATSFAQTDTAKSGLVWYSNIQEASSIAKAANKPLFAFFTGSDWCGWCHKLQRDVFAKPEFVAWAKKNVVLVELDFPRNKVLSPELQQQNQSLQQALQVRGYPTVWLLNLNLNADKTAYEIVRLGSLGYPSGSEPGKEQVKFLGDADQILKTTAGQN